MDTTVLIIIGTVLSILMLVIAVINASNSKTQSENEKNQKDRTIEKELAIQNAKLEVDIQYIKTQLATIQALMTTYNSDNHKLKEEMEIRMNAIETACKICQSNKRKEV